MRKVSIPQPCHEDWNKMTAAEKGRHCAVCDKVVEDFSKLDQGQFQDALAAGSGSCGRFRPDQLTVPELPSSIAYRYPRRRLRQFMIALVLVFGFEVFGFSSAEAQNLELDMQQAAEQGQLDIKAKGIKSEKISLSGMVLEDIEHRPVPFASVYVQSGGKIITGAISDVLGNFQLEFSLRDLEAHHYDLVVSYAGKERMQKRVETDIEEVLVLIDPSVILESVLIEGRSPYLLEDIEIVANRPPGLVVGQLIVGLRQITLHSQNLQQEYYHDMGTFLMMRNSEINQVDGGW